MRENVQDPEQFWAALNFWIFFAVGHPILQPILWISDVLHGSPGPMVANLVPITFIVGNVLAIAAFLSSKEVRMLGKLALEIALIDSLTEFCRRSVTTDTKGCQHCSSRGFLHVHRSRS